jgi:hypothetical protein
MAVETDKKAWGFLIEFKIKYLEASKLKNPAGFAKSHSF